MSARLSGHLILGQPAQFEQDEDTPLQHGLDEPGALGQQLRADPAVRFVLPRITFSGLFSNGDKSTVMLASAWIARRTVNRPLVAALAHT